MDTLEMLVISPVPTALLCVLYFIATVIRTGIGFRLTTGRFLGRVLLSVAACLGVVFALVIGATAIYNSPQGPLALIFYGPLGISIGMIIGTMLWRTAELRRQTGADHE